MSERPVSETGNLIRSGFLEIDKTKELLNTLKISTPREVLLEELSQVANPDEALLLLVRILEKNNKEFEKTIEDESIRFRLLKVLGSSSGLGEFLINHPEDIEVLSKETAINLAFSKEELTNKFKLALEDGRAGLVREYKKFLLSLAARDLCSNWPLKEVAQELSDAADAILESSLQKILSENESNNFDLAIIAMGKAGGQELNYVSDVDVIFIAEPKPGIDESEALQLATKVCSNLMQFISTTNDGGAIWELDAALRPEGKAGALVRTLEQHISYYQKWAHTWEFQALLKARFSAGNKELADKYLDEISKFVWSAASKENFVEDVQKMRKKVEENVDNKIGERELKLAPGGLRDVEFAVQLLQLVHGRSDVMVRSSNT